MNRSLIVAVFLVTSEQQPTAGTVDVTVTEGTSMAVAISPDGRTLAIDLHGTIWTLPATGGRARKLTDGFDDARQPSWSPDGRRIAYQGFRDGNYDIWIISADGTSQRKLTSGIFDDREPAWSRDGGRIAFSSDRASDGNYDIWTVDVRSGQVQRLTTGASNDYMPTWAPGDTAVAYVSARGANGGTGVWSVAVSGGTERRHSPAGVTADAPSWGPTGTIVYYASGAGASRLEIDGSPVTGAENAFPFRASWASPSEIVYTSDGKIRRRSVTPAAGDTTRTIPFSATFRVTKASFARKVRDVDSRAPRRVLGIVSPAIAPDGRQIAFAALGDIWMMPVGGKPVKVTDDPHLDTEPAWSPDGLQLAYASDRGGGFLNIWVRDLRTGSDRQITRVTTSAMGPAWSPDGARIAFLDVDGLWRRATVSVVDVATGKVTRLREAMFGPGTPTWSADGRRVAVAALVPYSSRFREGTNQILSLPADGIGETLTFPAHADKSIDSRSGAGPVWSPDGSRMAFVSEGILAVVPVASDGRPSGPPVRLTTGMAHSPSWSADSRRILYQSMDSLRIVDVGNRRTTAVPLELRYAPSIPSERVVVHGARIVDMKSPAVREGMDVVIEGNRIARVAPHSEAAHDRGTVIDASGLTMMPGLVEYHSHLQKDMGAAQYRAWLAFGVTTVRSPGGTPYEAVEDREAVDAGVRAGPRIYTAGYLMEWGRSYYKMSVAVASPAHLELELERSRRLQHDLVKSYVRMPDPQQRRIVQFAHAAGIPASSHEIYPSALTGIDGVEHTAGTSRRGYSPKVAPLQRSYSDVAAIIGAAGMTFTPTLALSGVWLRRMVDADTSLRNDARLGLMVPWVRSTFAAGQGGRGRGAQPATGGGAGAPGEMILAVAKAGGRIVAGTDTPNPASLHAELIAYVAAGMSPYDALRSATVTPARALGLPAGTIEPGQIADLVIVEGNPLDDIGNAKRVKWTIANGTVHSVADLVSRP